METVSKTNAHQTASISDPARLKSQPFRIPKELLESFLYGRQRVERIDVGKLKANRKRKADNNENEYSRKIKSLWCEECCKHIQDECPIHNHSNSDQAGPVLSYAVRSFPPEVQLCSSSIPGHMYGACAGKQIPRGTWIGPYEGKCVYSTKIPRSTDGAYVWEIYENGQFSHFVDGSDEASSSWMRFIRCARNKNEQNMGAFQYGKNIYYRALRDIPVDDEILVWYDHTYTQFWGVPLALNNETTAKEETMKKSPTMAQHSGLPGFRGTPQVAQQPPMSRPQTFPPAAERLPTQSGVHAATSGVPLQPQPASYPLQRQPQVSPHYQVPRSFQVQQPFQPPLSSPVAAPYPPSPQLPPFPMVPPSYRVPLQGKPISHVPPPQLPQSIFAPPATRLPQISPPSQLVPTNSPPGIPTASTFNGHGRMSYTTTVTSSPDYRWSPTEVKENLPVGGQTGAQVKPLVNSNPLKSSPLQNRSPSLTNTALSGPEESGYNYVSSTVGSTNNPDEQGSWKCSQCGKTFGQRLLLQKHVCDQSPERPFQCGHCSLTFTDSCELRDHVITHTNERPFKCGFCGRSFAGATTLNNHMRTHTGEKPFACEKCGRTFAIATQLSRHIKLPGECGMRNKDAQMYNQRAVITAEQ